MIDLLHAFAVGISFALGVFIGAWLCRIASEHGRQDLKQTQKEIEDRLVKQVAAQERMAEALEVIALRK